MDELDPYALVAEEMKAGIRHDALIARSWAESGGDRDRAQAIYIRLRAQEFTAAIQAARQKAEHEARAAKEEAKRQAADAAKQARERERERAAHERGEFWEDYGLYLLCLPLLLFVLFILSKTLGSGDDTSSSYHPTVSYAAPTPAGTATATPVPAVSQEAATRFVQGFLSAPVVPLPKTGPHRSPCRLAGGSNALCARFLGCRGTIRTRL